MAEGRRHGAQRLATPAMEEESRHWMVQCQKCGGERSVWELGGIRYKARGTSRLLRRCADCGRMSWNKVYWSGTAAPGEPGGPASAGFVARMVFAIVLGTILLTGAIILALFWLLGRL